MDLVLINKTSKLLNDVIIESGKPARTEYAKLNLIAFKFHSLCGVLSKEMCLPPVSFSPTHNDHGKLSDIDLAYANNLTEVAKMYTNED